MLNLTQRNMPMTDFQTPDEYFVGSVQKAQLWITTTHHDGPPLNPDGLKQSQKNIHLLARPII